MTDAKTTTISTRSHGEAVVRVLSETEKAIKLGGNLPAWFPSQRSAARERSPAGLTLASSTSSCSTPHTRRRSNEPAEIVKRLEQCQPTMAASQRATPYSHLSTGWQQSSKRQARTAPAPLVARS